MTSRNNIVALFSSYALISAVGAAYDPQTLYLEVSTAQMGFKAHTSTRFYDKYRAGLLSSHPVRSQHREGEVAVNSTINGDTLPSSYDFRTAFPNCASPLTLYDQGSCGGCWALSVASALSDRFCSVDVDVVLSPQDLLDCTEGSSKGCNGGFTEDGYDYAADEGVRLADCVPFTATDSYCAPPSSCTAKGEDATVYRTTNWAQYISSQEEKIQTELVNHGSISAVFEVFEDFFQYESGVYSHITGAYAGLHAVTLMGWGEDREGGEYWLVKNSWGEEFGEDGFFRIRRGLSENGCNFEGGLTAGTPVV